MNSVLLTDEAVSWINRLGDVIGKARILARIEQAKYGNFSDCESVGDGVSEMRIHYGPGYRLYYKRSGKLVYVVLCAGAKSTQKSDIKRAKFIASEL